ncbi:DUF5107 domain-containing protein [Bacteroidota bacterium]
MKRNVGLIVLASFILNSLNLFAQEIQISEKKRSFLTYNFSDPNPIANPDKIYPYFRFDGYEKDGQDKDWNIIKLENKYIEVLMAPEIGGKILGAFEKSTGNSFIYFNNVIKFRDIAQRGAWTSGGIEYNFGSIGHTPASATPVDYTYRKNDDGSISCFFGGLDLSSRTEWRVEVKLPKDKAYFETIATWYNSTEQNTSLYHWMNASTDVGEDMEYVYPGQNYIDHGGNKFPWTINKNNIDISFYANNAFGPDKSYHVLGKYTDFLGTYWHDKKFGSGHWSLYPEKVGKKIWMWSQARKGAIWVDLLTDPKLGNIQYTEIQTGILFNQSANNSTKTPFKHLFFAPYSYEKFPEIWFPYKNTGGITEANKHGVLHLNLENNKLKFALCALDQINSDVIVKSGNKEVFRSAVSLLPMDTFSEIVDIDASQKIEIIIGNRLIYYCSTDEESKNLDRPAVANPDFDWSSVYGMWKQASEYAKQRNYVAALESYELCLKKDPSYSPSLVGAGQIYYKKMDYKKAAQYYLKAMANDTYDADANFHYASLCRKLGDNYNAIDAYGIAARSVKYRSAAYLGLSETYYIIGRNSDAEYFAKASLDYNINQINALKILAILSRINNNNSESEEHINKIISKDPLNHFANFEKYFNSADKKDLDYAKSMIRNELAHETYIELAIYYYNLGLNEEAVDILKECPTHPVAFYWLAYLDNEENQTAYLEKAISLSPELVFPFREETAGVLEWAGKISPNWKAKYYLALIHWSRNNINNVARLFTSCGTRPDFGPFYLSRGNFYSEKSIETAIKNYEKAIELDPLLWRAYHILFESRVKTNNFDEALIIAEKANMLFPENFVIEFNYARALLFKNRFKESIKILDNINILPNEGARSGHDIYRMAHLLYALENINNGKNANASKLIEKARLWPENLGVGRSYDVDERPEDFLEAMTYMRAGRITKARQIFEKITKYSEKTNTLNSNHYINILAWKYSGRTDMALELLDKWHKAQPDDPIVNWAKNMYDGNKNAAEKALSGNITNKEGSPWNPAGNDYNFKLVYEIANNINE